MEVIEKVYFNRLLDLLDDINTKLEILVPRDEKNTKQVIPSEEFEEIEKYTNFFSQYGTSSYAGWFIEERIQPMVRATKAKFGKEKSYEIVRTAERISNSKTLFDFDRYLNYVPWWK